MNNYTENIKFHFVHFTWISLTELLRNKYFPWKRRKLGQEHLALASDMCLWNRLFSVALAKSRFRINDWIYFAKKLIQVIRTKFCTFVISLIEKHDL
jgi:hypothetical protein